jgi:hypothetical protein
MITDRDIAMRTEADGRDSNQMNVSDAMSVDVICCGQNESVETAATIMRTAHVQRLAVTKGDGRLVGILSMSDVGGTSSERHPFEVVFLMRVSVAQGSKPEAVEQPSLSSKKPIESRTGPRSLAGTMSRAFMLVQTVQTLKTSIAPLNATPAFVLARASCGNRLVPR